MLRFVATQKTKIDLTPLRHVGTFFESPLHISNPFYLKMRWGRRGTVNGMVVGLGVSLAWLCLGGSLA